MPAVFAICLFHDVTLAKEALLKRFECFDARVFGHLDGRDPEILQLANDVGALRLLTVKEIFKRIQDSWFKIQELNLLQVHAHPTDFQEGRLEGGAEDKEILLQGLGTLFLPRQQRGKCQNRNTE